jgi:two-component system CheB/CheR fusion protein
LRYGAACREGSDVTSQDAAGAARDVHQPRRAGIVAAVGASAGGLKALQELFGELPAGRDVAYVVIVHGHPDHESLLPDLLARHTPLRVTRLEEGCELEADRVYVAPFGARAELAAGRVRLVAQPAGSHLPIDGFFRSLAADRGERAIGVVLSGTGSDGTLGVGEIKGAGGVTMAQAPATASHAGMPESAIATRLVDFVGSPAELAYHVARQVERATSEPRADEAEERRALKLILGTLRDRTGHDFSGYKASTLIRRIQRRIQLRDVEGPRAYAEILAEDPVESESLFRDFLIGVTGFFRDPDAFQRLERSLDEYLAVLPQGERFRAWVAGCSSGEEAYSIAIALRERLLEAGRAIEAQIFATDIDPAAIERARRGVYPEGIAAQVGRQRLQRFFTATPEGYRVTPDIREMLVFAAQNVIRDPPFTRLDLVSCRNVLIYLAAPQQHRVLSLFHHALKPSGTLFLGTSESIGAFEGAFAVADKKAKIFRKATDRGPMKAEFDLHPQADGVRALPAAEPEPGRRWIAPLLERTLLKSFVPPSVIITPAAEILYVHGRTGKYLELAPGEPSSGLLEMAREGLRLTLGSMLREAASTEEPLVRRGVQVRTDGAVESVTISIRRLTQPAAVRGLLVVSFDSEPEARPEETSTMTTSSKVSNELEDELQRVHESLQGTIEELETSNEELKSTNEELQSTNEELQSANEELETSREEMQSLNEELQTVNVELEERNRALSQTNDDMQNLLNSTDIATVFLDANLHVKRFTGPARSVFCLIDSDVGRPIADLAANLDYDRVLGDATDVLRTLRFHERELETKSGWRLMRIIPYRTADNVIDGLVMTFTDIDRVKQAERAAEAARRYAETLSEATGDAVVSLDAELRVNFANDVFCRLASAAPRSLVGQTLASLGERVAPLMEAVSQLEDGAKRELRLRDVLGVREMNVRACALAGSADDARFLLVLTPLAESR